MGIEGGIHVDVMVILGCGYGENMQWVCGFYVVYVWCVCVCCVCVVCVVCVCCVCVVCALGVWVVRAMCALLLWVFKNLCMICDSCSCRCSPCSLLLLYIP